MKKICLENGCYRFVSPSNSNACSDLHRAILRNDYMSNYNAKTKYFSELFKWHEKVLESIYNKYPNGELIDVDEFLFLGKDFNWDISDGTFYLDQQPVTKIGNFGYQLFNNHTIKIYEL